MDKKIYNLKQSSLGKITFDEENIFININSLSNEEKFNHSIIIENEKNFLISIGQWLNEIIEINFLDKKELMNKINEYIINNSDENIFNDFKNAFDKFEIKNDFEFNDLKTNYNLLLTYLAYICFYYQEENNIVIENLINISISFVKNIIGINFWND